MPEALTQRKGKEGRCIVEAGNPIEHYSHADDAQFLPIPEPKSEFWLVEDELTSLVLFVGGVVLSIV